MHTVGNPDNPVRLENGSCSCQFVALPPLSNHPNISKVHPVFSTSHSHSYKHITISTYIISISYYLNSSPFMYSDIFDFSGSLGVIIP